MNLKLISKALLFVSLLFCANVLFAQYPGMAAFRSQQTLQFARQQMNMQMNMQTWMMNRNSSYNPKYKFVVTMKDGSTKEVKSRIYYDTTLKKTYLLLVDKHYKRSDSNRYQKIYPQQTLSIARDTSWAQESIGTNGKPVQTEPLYTGKATDSCWMFRVISGPISAYSYSSEESDSQYFTPTSIIAIQLNDGPIIKFTEDNLKQMVGDRINVLEPIQLKNYYWAIRRYNRDIEKERKK